MINDPDEAAAAELLQRFFEQLGQEPLAAQRSDVARLRAGLAAQVGPERRDAVARFIGRFYGEAYLAGQVRYVVAHAAGASALLLSPDRPLLLEVQDAHPGDRDAARAMRMLAAYFIRLGKGPLEATPDEVRALCDDGLAALPLSERSTARDGMAAFYARARARDLVTAAVHEAATTPVPQAERELNAPYDERILRSFIARHSKSQGNYLATVMNFLARRNASLVTATAADLLAYHAHLRDRSVRDKRPLAIMRTVYREQLAAGRVSPAVAIAAGVREHDVSPEFWELRRFIVSHRTDTLVGHRPDTQWSSSLSFLAAWLVSRQTNPIAATPDDLRAFATDAFTGRPDVPADEYQRRMARLYVHLHAQGLVSPAQAVAAQADPLTVSPDSEALLAWKRQARRDAAPVVRLTLHFAEFDRGPLSATPEELEVFVDTAFEGLARATEAIYRTTVGEFYAMQHAAGRVSLAVAIAGGAKPLVVTPDRRELEEFLGTVGTHTRRADALAALARLCGRQGRGPLDATDRDLAEFSRAEGTAGMRIATEFYAAYPRR